MKDSGVVFVRLGFSRVVGFGIFRVSGLVRGLRVQDEGKQGQAYQMVKRVKIRLISW